MNETETQFLLRNAKGGLQYCIDRESELRRQLAEAMDSTKKARAKVDELFLREEKEAAERLRGEYRHCTK